MTDCRDSAVSLVRDGHHPGKNARPRESFPCGTHPVVIRANDTLSAQPGEGRKAKKKKKTYSYGAPGGIAFIIEFGMQTKQDNKTTNARSTS